MKAQTFFVSSVALAASPFIVGSVHASGNSVGSVDATYLNVRTGPSMNDSVIGGLQNQSKVTILGENGNWYKIQYNNQEAYVSKDYVTVSSSKNKVANKGTYKVTADVLRVRSDASTSSSIIGLLSNGDEVTVESDNNGWCKITYNNQTAYVSKDFLTPSSTDNSSSNSNSVQSTSTLYVNADSLHFRTGPGTNYSVIDVLSNGDKLEVTGQSGNWYKVHFNGSDGYVYKDYVSTSQNSSTSQNTSSSQNVSNSTTSSDSTSQASSIFNSMPALLSYAKSLEGVPYEFGGKTPNGFDCSGFIYYVYNKYGYSFGRQSANSYWNSFTRTSNPLPGDLVYFQGTYNTNGASHIGIYLGNGNFISAASNGVSVSSLSNPYWSKHFLGYTRPY
ncbi:SH3 domain-containing protein [Ectobacillus polymachus]|uniref:C40 family peptidase n=1 Tax=Ectobacillus polymachus TaxID=1508806 RepID=UPI003A8B42D0